MPEDSKLRGQSQADSVSTYIRWLMLLPHPPSKRFYSRGLEKSLLQASALSSQSSRTVVLYIGFPCEKACSRVKIYEALQKQHASLYRKVCFLTAQHAIDIANSNDVDVRIFAFSDLAVSGSDVSSMPEATGLPTLQLFASSRHKWDRVKSIDNEEGSSQMARFLDFKQSSGGINDLSVEKLPSEFDRSEENPWPTIVGQRHHSAAVGGTFDHLHPGHKLLLTMTGLRLDPLDSNEHGKTPTGQRLTIGITSDDLLKNKEFHEEMQSWDERFAHVRDFVSSLLQLQMPMDFLTSTVEESNGDPVSRNIYHHYDSGLTIHYAEIHDPFGPTITEELISALIISGETRAGGKAVNDRRQEKGWAPLEIFEVDVLNAEESVDEINSTRTADFKGKISSTDIRRRIHEKKT